MHMYITSCTHTHTHTLHRLIPAETTWCTITPFVHNHTLPRYRITTFTIHTHVYIITHIFIHTHVHTLSHTQAQTSLHDARRCDFVQNNSLWYLRQIREAALFEIFSQLGFFFCRERYRTWHSMWVGFTKYLLVYVSHKLWHTKWRNRVFWTSGTTCEKCENDFLLYKNFDEGGKRHSGMGMDHNL